MIGFASQARRGTIFGLFLLVAEAAIAAAGPARIVSLAPSTTESLFALGVGDRVVGVSTYCDYPAEVTRIERVGTFLLPNVEAILARKPDLIVAVPSPGNRAPIERLQALGIRVLIVNPDSVAEIARSLLTIGREVERSDRAEQLVRELRARMDAVRRRVAGRPLRRVLMVVGHTPLIAVGRGTFQSELIELASGHNVVAEVGEGWPHLSVEFPLKAAPEVIIDTSMGNEGLRDDAAAREYWGRFPGIPAVRDKRIFGAGAFVLLHPGPRVADAFEVLARFLHPEAFE